MTDSFPLPLPEYEIHARQFVHNDADHHHRPASGFCHNWKLRLPQFPILKATSKDNVHILVPFFSEARFPLPGHGHFFYFSIVRIRTVYAVNILLASSRMLITALRSLSILFPHTAIDSNWGIIGVYALLTTEELFRLAVSLIIFKRRKWIISLC